MHAANGHADLESFNGAGDGRATTARGFVMGNMIVSDSLSQAEKEVQFVDGETTVPANFLSAVPFQVADTADAAKLLEAVQDATQKGHGRFFMLDDYATVASGVDVSVDPWTKIADIDIGGDDCKAIASNGQYVVAVVSITTGPDVKAYELDRDGNPLRELVLTTGQAGVSYACAVAGKYAAIVTGRYVNLFDLSQNRDAATINADLSAEWEFDHTVPILAVDLDAFRVYIAGDDEAGNNYHLRAIGISDGLEDWGVDCGSGGAAQNAVATDGWHVYVAGNDGTGGAHVQAFTVGTGTASSTFDPVVLPNTAIDLVMDDRNLYVATSADLFVINRSLGMVTRIYPDVADATTRLACDDRFLAVVQPAAGTVALLEKATFTVVSIVAYDAIEEPYDVAIDNCRMYIAGEAKAASANENVRRIRMVRPAQIMQFIDYRFIEHGAPRLVGRMEGGPTPMLQMAGYGEIYVSTPAATSIGSASTWYDANGTYTFSTPNHEFEMSTNGQLRYIGHQPRVMHIAASFSIQAASAGVEVWVGVAKNGTVITPSVVKQDYGNNTDVLSSAAHAFVQLDPGDYLSVRVYNASSGTNVTFQTLNLFAMSMHKVR